MPFWVNLTWRRISASVIVVLNNSNSLNHCLRVMAGVPVILTTVFVVAVANCAENNEEQSDDEDADNWVRRAMDDFDLWVVINDDKLWVLEILTILVVIVVLAGSVIDCDNDSNRVGVSVTISSSHVWTIVSIDIA